jgi:hypothetical protein
LFLKSGSRERLEGIGVREKDIRTIEYDVKQINLSTYGSNCFVSNLSRGWGKKEISAPL